MHISNIKLWNFRKFGSNSELKIEEPNINLDLDPGLNVLIGENDSGKTAVIDAIKLVLKTESYEWIRPVDDDFCEDSDRFRIELVFRGMSDGEAKNFTEWLGWTKISKEGEPDRFIPFLRLIYDVSRTEDRILPSDVKAGVDNDGYSLDAEARDYLKTTYLKPLRDAKAELVPRKNSRLSNIFQEHEAFKGKGDSHRLVTIFQQFNAEVEGYFEGIDSEGETLEDDQKGKELKDQIDAYLKSFYDQLKTSEITTVDVKLKSILEKLELAVKDEINPGLGTLNRLFMASELVHLNKKNWTGVRLALIEELEAHLHPQAQMQVIESLQQQKDIQLILTTHSPNLASKVKLKNLVLFDSNEGFSLQPKMTKLSKDNYAHLERFLDVTKANLFFAKGVIFVEGWSEEILLPSIARKLKQQGVISRELTQAGVSIVNIGNIGFEHFSRIFLRQEEPHMSIPVAIVTDSDIRAFKRVGKLDEDGHIIRKENGKIDYDYLPIDGNTFNSESGERTEELEALLSNQNVKSFITKLWTLEYSLFKSSSLSEVFKKAAIKVHPGMNTGNFEKKLAKKLIIKTLDKTDIAYEIASELDADIRREHPEIDLDVSDSGVKNIIDAIKYVCHD